MGTNERATAEARDPLEDKPPELGPDAVQILEGSTFAVSDAVGDMPDSLQRAEGQRPYVRARHQRSHPVD
jgi:hypothetical protein